MNPETTCTKCQGLLSTCYDILWRQAYRYCMNCGARPDIHRRRSDGMEIGAPGLCQTCKQAPRVSVQYPNKGVVWTPLCITCRVEYLRKRQTKRRSMLKEFTFE